MASGRTGNVILPVRIATATASSDVVLWRLRKNPTTISGNWIPATNGRGNIETIASGTFSGGTIIDSGFVSQGTANNYETPVAIRLALGIDELGESDVLILTVDSENNAKALGMIGWVEVV
jgi:hypothetical protein